MALATTCKTARAPSLVLASRASRPGQTLRRLSGTSSTRTERKWTETQAKREGVVNSVSFVEVEEEFDRVATETKVASKDGKFDFTRQWYPVGVVIDCERRASKREPIEVHLLGDRYVLWTSPKPKKGETREWSASLDVCPHRLAPLSEGRVGDRGEIMCSYHGWEFEGCGRCSKIPQAPKAKVDKLCSSASAQLGIHPVKEKYGLLWMWADASPEGIEKSRSCEPMNIEPLNAVESDEVVTMSNSWYQRDITYDWDTLVENIVDPTHVPFAHHGIQGRRDKPGEFGLKLDKVGKNEGVRVHLISKDSMDGQRLGDSFIEFRPPHLIRYNFSSFLHNNAKNKVQKKRAANILVLATPTTPGNVRVIFKFVIVNADTLPRIARWISKLRPKWMDHQTRNRVFDSDGYLLYLQEKELATDKKDWKQKFFMPTNADALVTGFRVWIDRFTNNGPYQGTSERSVKELTKREVLDRYEQHTKHCHICMGALRGFKIFQGLGVSGLLVSLLARSWVGAVLSLAAVLWAEHWKKRFYFVDHVHAHQP